jgi:hypothetical protein
VISFFINQIYIEIHAIFNIPFIAILFSTGEIRRGNLPHSAQSPLNEQFGWKEFLAGKAQQRNARGSD